MKNGTERITNTEILGRIGLRGGLSGLLALFLLTAAHPGRAEDEKVSPHLPDDAQKSTSSGGKIEAAKLDASTLAAAKSPAAAPVVTPVPPPGTESAAKPTAVDAVTGTPAPAKPRPIRNLLSFGGDLYFGGTNATGVRARNNDGMWAGFGSAYPSLLSVNWRQDEARGLRLSVGVGDMFTASGTSLRQPVEATYQFPVAGNATMTVGKFYVPFATQEWEYESKYGVMLQKSQGAMTFTGALNYNFKREAPNVYMRVGRQFGANTTVGLSAGGGRGVFSDSSHALALGLDVAHDFGGVQFSTEYNLAQGAKGPFQFVYGKLTLTKAGRFLPYVGAYYWHDTAQELGQYHSLLAGLGYKMNQHLTIEGGYARGNARNIFWLQSHVTF